jgi:hypothetical protein
MGRVLMALRLRGAKTMLFLLAVISVSAFLTVSDSRPTKAEGLLYTVGCTVGRLLGGTCQRTADPAPSSPLAPSSQTPTGSPTQTPASPPAQAGTPAPTESPVAAPTTPAPIEVNEALLQDLPAIAPVESTSSSRSSNTAAYALPAAFGGPDSAVLASSSAPAPLQATENGWQIFGISWVWWAVSIVVATGVTYAMRHVLAKPWGNVVK